MDAVLQKQLQMQIEQQLEVKVLDVVHFTIPYSIVDVNYTPIIKKRMDILMKMLLTSYQSGQFTDSEQLASILMVESLFINDLTRQMEKSKLITIDEHVTLTSKGEEQLKQGIYEEQLPETNSELVYSILHDQFFALAIDELELQLDLPEPLEYVDEHKETIQDELVIAAIEQLLLNSNSEQQVQSINNTEIVELYDFPIALYICFDQKNDRLFSRAFNIYQNEWDDVVSSFMDKKEVVKWRTQYL